MDNYPEAAAAEALRLSLLGPHAHLSSDRCTTSTIVVGGVSRATTTIVNTGTTALWYEWKRVAPRTLPHATGTGPEAFYLADVEGSVLPGQSKEIVWTFKSGASHLTLVPIRPRSRCGRRFLRTFSPGDSLRPGSLAFNPDAPRRLSTPLLTPLNSTPTFVASYGTRLIRQAGDVHGQVAGGDEAEFAQRADARGDAARVRDAGGRALASATRADERDGTQGDGAQGVHRGVQGAFSSHWSPYDPVGVVNADP